MDALSSSPIISQPPSDNRPYPSQSSSSLHHSASLRNEPVCFCFLLFSFLSRAYSASLLLIRRDGVEMEVCARSRWKDKGEVGMASEEEQLRCWQLRGGIGERLRESVACETRFRIRAHIRTCGPRASMPQGSNGRGHIFAT